MLAAAIVSVFPSSAHAGTIEEPVLLLPPLGLGWKICRTKTIGADVRHAGSMVILVLLIYNITPFHRLLMSTIRHLLALVLASASGNRRTISFMGIYTPQDARSEYDTQLAKMNFFGNTAIVVFLVDGSM